MVSWRDPEGWNLQVKILKGGKYAYSSVPDELLKGKHDTWRKSLGQVEIPDRGKREKEFLPLVVLDITIFQMAWRKLSLEDVEVFHRGNEGPRKARATNLCQR